MTSPDPRVLDLTAFDCPDDRRPRLDHADLHMLRLALDLQLDALLLTLGAAAHAETRGDSADTVPWRRWLIEDLELARTLATVLVDCDGSPLPALGGGLAHGAVTTSLDNLAARYESMERLLTGVLDRPTNGQQWRGGAGDALTRCRSRLVELHRHRQVAIAAAATSRTTSLPGEWLG